MKKEGILKRLKNIEEKKKKTDKTEYQGERKYD